MLFPLIYTKQEEVEPEKNGWNSVCSLVTGAESVHNVYCETGNFYVYEMLTNFDSGLDFHETSLPTNILIKIDTTSIFCKS